MSYQNDILFISLKKLLKNRKITYLQLAEHLGTTEAAIKNSIHKKKLSIDKLASVCDVLGIRLVDLFDYSADFSNGEFQFSEEAEHYLVENHQAFKLFDQLYFKKKNLKVLEEEGLFDPEEVVKIMKELENYGILERGINSNFTFIVKGQLKWREGGPWMKKNYVDITTKQAQLIMEEYKTGEIPYCHFGLIHLSNEQFSNFRKETDELLTKYKKLSYHRQISGNIENDVDIGFNFKILDKYPT